MARTVFYLVLLVLMIFIVHIEGKGKKPSKHSIHVPGGRSPHHHHRHHHHGGRSKHGHGHHHHHGHGHDHHHGVHDHGNDYGHGNGYYDHHSSRNDLGPAGRVGSSHYETGYRHRRDIIINGTNQMTDIAPSQETSTSSPGWCSKVVSVTVTFAQSFQKSRKVPAIVRCGWLHLAKCKVYKISYELLYRQATRVVYAKIRKCCPGFMEINGMCEPIGDRTTPPATTKMQTTPVMNATTTPMMTTTDNIPDDYKEMLDDKIQKLVSAIIILLLLICTVCSIVGCVIYLCKLCHKHKRASYI